jgi:hypothetical protein
MSEDKFEGVKLEDAKIKLNYIEIQMSSLNKTMRDLNYQAIVYQSIIKYLERDVIKEDD